MSINTTMRFTILASALALAAAAPVAFAQGTGTWYQGIHTDSQIGSSDSPPASHTRYVMEKKIVPSKPAGNEVAQSIGLTDGSTVHVFGDGKMAMEDKFGHATYMEPGHTMKTRDGKKIVMNGNEVARLYQLLNKNNFGS